MRTLFLHLRSQPKRPVSVQKLLRHLLALILAVAPMAGELLAQPIGGPPPCWPPPCIPIDGGIGLLAAAGALLGGKVALAMRQQRNNGQ